MAPWIRALAWSTVWLVGCSSKGADSAGADAGPAHPYSGAWNGEVFGYAEFDPAWETEPYCAGNLYAVVDGEGTFEGGGACTITWGPAEGETFDASVTGTIDEVGAFVLQVVFDYDTTERSWERATLRGTSDGTTLTARSATLYNPSTGGTLDAFAEVDLTR